LLLNDKNKLVEVYMENVLWGNVTLHFRSTESTFQMTRDEIIKFRDDMKTWSIMRLQVPPNPEFKKLTNSLYLEIVDCRLTGLITGKFEDPDEVIEKLKSDNERLVGIIADQKKQLDQLYLESPDKKNIRGIS